MTNYPPREVNSQKISELYLSDDAMLEAFGLWLKRGNYHTHTISSRKSDLRNIATTYGSLVSAWEKDGCSSIFDDLYEKRQLAKTDRKAYNIFSNKISVLRLFLQFLLRKAVVPVHQQIVQQLDAAIKAWMPPNKKGLRKKDVANKIQKPLIKQLNSALSGDYDFEEEFVPGTKIKGKKVGDAFDILGIPKSNLKLPKIIIEIDTHRADQVTKKLVSRIAAFADEEVIYVAIIYGNDHSAKEAEQRELDKYLEYCRRLLNAMQPKKTFIPILLY